MGIYTSLFHRQMVATPTHSKNKNTVNTHTLMHTHAHTQITLISVDSYAQHVYNCTVVLIVLTFTTLQTRSFRVSWNVREASY